MKNKKLKALSVLLSLCLSGTLPAGAADFSDGAAKEGTIIENTETPGNVFGTDTLEEFQANDPEDDVDSFTSETNENNTFSSDESSVDMDEKVEVADDLSNSVSPYFKRWTKEADIEIDPSVTTTCTIYKGDNLEEQNYSTNASTIDSYLTQSPDGRIMRVQAGALENKLLIEYYDASYNLLETVTLNLPLPIFGAFYESNDNYYILTGDENPAADDSKEVFRVTKYTKNWKNLGSCSLFGCNTTIPFQSGSARMTMYGNYLFIRTCHRMYHGTQGNATFSVDTVNMNIVDEFTEVSNGTNGYVSLSLNQFIKVDNGKLLGVDHGNAYPRALAIFKYPPDISEGHFISYNYREYCEEIEVLSFPPIAGRPFNSYTGASVGGFEISDSSYLFAGSYDTDDEHSARNVFVASVNKSTNTPVIRYLTNYAGTDDTASTPHLIKTGQNSFIIMWSSKCYVYYTTLDGTGLQTGSIYKMKGNLSDCVPSIINGKLIWYTWRRESMTFYSVNLSNLSENHATRIINGHKYASGKAVNGRVKQTCTVCRQQRTVSVPVSIKVRGRLMDQYYDYPMGKTHYLHLGESENFWWETAMNPDNDSYPVLSDCEIIISDESILSYQEDDDVSDRPFLTAKKTGVATVTVRSVYDPNVSYTTTIYVNTFSDEYFYLSLSPINYNYDGTKHKPNVKLKELYNRSAVFKEGIDYNVSFDKDLINAGKVHVTVTGIGKYKGTVHNSFTIYPVSSKITAQNMTLDQGTKKYPVITDAVTDGNITLKSSNSKVVKVSGTNIIPVSPGKATVTIIAEKGRNYKASKKTVTVTVRPLTVSGLSLKSTLKGQATVSWTSAKSVSGYQIYYSQNSNMKGAESVTAKSTAKSAILENLASKKKYYIRIRTYKTVNGKKYYSSWSAVKSVTVK